MKKVLVTGGAGFIGTNLINRLILKKLKIVSFDNYSTGFKKNEVESVEYIKGDIESINQFDNQQFDYCFHLAAQSRVQPSFKDPEESFRINVVGTLKVMEWAKKNKVKVLYAGSSSKHHDPSDSPYAMTKYLGEEICKLYRKTYDVEAEISRFYNVYGPYEPLDENFGNVIGIWRVKVNNGSPLPIVGDGEQRRDFTHVDDIVEGIIKSSLFISKKEDVFELGSGKNYSINELADMFGEDYPKKYLPHRDGEMRTTLCDISSAKQKINYVPTRDLKEYISNWANKNKKNISQS